MITTAAVGFMEMRIAKVVGFGPPLAEEGFRCVVLDEVSGDRHLVIEIGDAEAFSLAASLQGIQFGRPMTYQFAAALVRGLGGPPGADRSPGGRRVRRYGGGRGAARGAASRRAVQ